MEIPQPSAQFLLELPLCNVPCISGVQKIIVIFQYINRKTYISRNFKTSIHITVFLIFLSLFDYEFHCKRSLTINVESAYINLIGVLNIINTLVLRSILLKIRYVA